jgi:transcriptional regulator with XRE-family HTH domain
MNRGIITKIRERIKPETRNYVSKNLDITEQVFSILDKNNITQKEFARLLEKNESEVSKWLSGFHNLTLKSISKMEAILNADIITTPQKAEKKYGGIKYIVYHTQEIKSIEEEEGFSANWKIQQKNNFEIFQNYHKSIAK